jgi:hypothetical protein
VLLFGDGILLSLVPHMVDLKVPMSVAAVDGLMALLVKG